MQQPSMNEEYIILQQIEKELSQDPGLSLCCKQIGQQNHNPRLCTFLQELFKILANPYGSTGSDSAQKAIKILNMLLNKKLKNNKQVEISDIKHYSDRKYFDALANFYEKAFLKGYDEALKAAKYSYYKKIVIDYCQSNQVPQQTTNSLLSKIDQANQNPAITSLEVFEQTLFEILDPDPEEQEFFMKIVEEDQSKTPKLQNTLLEKFISINTDMKELVKQSQSQDIYSFRDYLMKEKIKGVEKVQGFLFYDRLKTYLSQHYFTSQADKIIGKKKELQNHLNNLEKELTEKEKDYFSFLEINNVKYFYKSLKLKKLKQNLRANFRIGAKLDDFIKQEINQVELQKTLRNNKKWREIYLTLNKELLESKDPEQIFQIILNLQQLMLHFQRFRWNYLFLFSVVIVENNFPENILEKILDCIFDMIQQTTRDKLHLQFDEILKKLKEKSQENIIWFSERLGPQLGYQSSFVLENQLKFVHNKLFRIAINSQQLSNCQLMEVAQFEVNLFNEFNNNKVQKLPQILKFLDSILTGEKDDKEQKAQFLKTYMFIFREKLQWITSEKSSIQQKPSVFTYFPQAFRLREDFKTHKLGVFQDIFERENKIADICIQYTTKEFSKYITNQQQNENFKLLLTNCENLFFKDNPFVVFIPQFIRFWIFFKQKNNMLEKIERVKFLAVAFVSKKENEISNFIEFMQNQREQNSLEYQYKIAQEVYNFYITLPSAQTQENKDNKEQAKPWLDNFLNGKTLQDFNTPQFNMNCILINKIYGDQKMSFKFDDSSFIHQVKALSPLIQDKNFLENSNHENKNPFLGQLIQYYNDLKNYKTQLIKDCQTFNDQNFTAKCIEVFSKYSQKAQILNEIQEYKLKNKLNFNEQELFAQIKQLWQKIGSEEMKNEKSPERRNKIQEYFKSLFQSQNSQIFINKLQNDMNGIQDQFIKDLIKKNFQQTKVEYDKHQTRAVQPPVASRQNILQMNYVAKKFQQIKNDVKYKEIIVDDQQVNNFISEQFNLFMKNLLGKIFQAVLTQKPGYEFKVYQNKTINQNDSQQEKYKQQLELQQKYGPQRNIQLDLSLLTSVENKNQLFYELCDYTPIQRQGEFRNFMIEIEPHQEDKLKNKIRKSKWKEEHPELEEILKKKIKRGAELWNQVQDFLCKRENNDYTGDSDEESEKIKGQAQLQMDNIDDDQIDLKVQDCLRTSEKQLQNQKAFIKTRLNNIENDNHLLTSKVITVKTVQYILEQEPYFKKSKVLYKSYIL